MSIFIPSWWLNALLEPLPVGEYHFITAFENQSAVGSWWVSSLVLACNNILCWIINEPWLSLFSPLSVGHTEQIKRNKYNTYCWHGVSSCNLPMSALMHSCCCSPSKFMVCVFENALLRISISSCIASCHILYLHQGPATSRRSSLNGY
jgi:hypothetical protein